MNTQMTLIGYSTTLGFVNELSKHMKIIKICDNSHLTDCFADKFYWGSDNSEVDTPDLTTSENLEKEDYDTELVGVMFANGVNAIMAYNKHCTTQDPYSNQINTTGCLAMIYDVDGFTKPNTFAKDLRAFNGVSISVLGDCDYKVKGICMTTAFLSDPVSAFKDKATYDSLKGIVYNVPITEMYSNGYNDWTQDYWAAARYTCMQRGGDLPTMNEIDIIGDYIYNDGPYGTHYNPDRLAKTPITIPPGGHTVYWNSEEIFYNGLNSSSFFYETSQKINPGYTSAGTPRYNGGPFSIMAFCVK